MSKAVPAKSSAPLAVLALIMLVNAIAYASIIPLLYPYAQRFGINAVGLSFLFTSFSIAQFMATPILGRLSDKFGRKPILLLCLLGTSASLALFAAATNVMVLFIARIIDGVTGGNISVAQAMIADKSDEKERPKAFAMLGAAFGFGFLVGPALGGFMSQFGLSAPFWFSAALALFGVILGAMVLPETLPKRVNRSVTQKLPQLFNMMHILRALFMPVTGIILLMTFLVSIAQNAFIIGIQSYMVDSLRLTPFHTGLVFASVGIVNIFSQALGIRVLLKVVPSKKAIITLSLITTGITMALLPFQTTFNSFMVNLVAFALLSSPLIPVITGLLSERTKAEDQGGILGINQAYTSLGQIAGPLLAGLVASRFPVTNIFFLSSGAFLASLVASRWLYLKPRGKFDL